jgi:pimeloyl-ACP methyl ester carboxylesterase
MPLALLLLLASPDTGLIRDIEVAPGEIIRTTSFGSGTPVVLIPGIFGGAFSYRKLIAPLAGQGYQLTVVEPLGTGESAYPLDADYSLAAQTDRIARALAVLGVSRALVVAHAMGSSLAVRLCYRRPHLVRGVLAIDSGPAETAATPGLLNALRFAGLAKLLFGSKALRRRVRHDMIANSGDTTWVTTDVVDSYTAGPARDIARTIDVFGRMAQAREPESMRERLGECRAPVRVLMAGIPHSSGIQPPEVALLRRRLRDFSVETVAGSGQYIHEEQPHIVVDAVVQLSQAAN